MAKSHNISLFARARRHSDRSTNITAERLSATDDAVFVLRNGEVDSASHTVRDLLGLEPELCGGRTLSELFGLSAYMVLDELQTAAETAGGHLATHRGLPLEDVDGNIVWVDVTMADLRHESNVHATVMTIHDVSDRIEMERRISEIEHHDPLTETANAAMFDVLLSRALDQSSYVGVVIVGTPGLTETNETYGIDFGDAVLIDISRRLASVLRTGDHVARVTNVQFAMIVHHLDDADPMRDLGEVAERLTVVLDTPFVMGGISTRVTTTVRTGCSAKDDDATEFVRRVLKTEGVPVGVTA
jgi:diguanylate cyclase (GGDEF)-like protein/PAS domain S-box-containing protein